MFTTMKYILVLIILMYNSRNICVADASTTPTIDTGSTGSPTDVTGSTGSSSGSPAGDTGSTGLTISDTGSTGSSSGDTGSTGSPNGDTGSPGSTTDSTGSSSDGTGSTGSSAGVTGSTGSPTGSTVSTAKEPIQCYNVVCSTEDCLKNETRLCTKPENGACFISKSGKLYSSGCQNTTCEWEQMTTSEGLTKTKNCCTSEKCNADVGLLNTGNYVSISLLTLAITSCLHLFW